jgi:hypothetical protein
VPAGVGLIVVLAGLVVTATTAMPRYNDGCQDCHGAFGDDTSPKGTIFPEGGKHQMHNGQDYMNTDCDLCHLDGDGRNPFLNMSNGTGNNPGLGCLGCHGREYPGLGVSGAGLRLNHFNNGEELCAQCHVDDPPPLPENVKPIYYGTPDTNVDDPCNAGPDFRENWSLDADNTDGLDNDGEDVYDLDDPDCATDPCPWDLTGDGFIGINDLLILLANWGPNAGHPADFNGDDFVGINDLLALLANWGSCG